MSILINIAVTDTATPELKRLLEQVEPGGPMGTVMGRALANVLRAHFRERNKAPNKLGGKRTNFWSRVAQGVQNPVASGRTVSVTVSHEAIAQKVFGGRIVPTKKKALAIPIHPAAHGNSPRVFPMLRYVSGPKGPGLAMPEADGTLTWWYVLRKSVMQPPDPAALPAEGSMTSAMLEAARDFLED